MEATTVPAGPTADLAARKRHRCPSCSAPIVGTKATGELQFGRSWRRSEESGMVLMEMTSERDFPLVIVAISK